MGGNGNSRAPPEGIPGGQNQRLLLETLMALQTHGGQSSGGQAGDGGGMTPRGPGHGPGPMRQGLPMSGGGNWGSLGWSPMGSCPPGAGGPGMGLPGISESLLSVYAPGFPGGGMGGPGMGGPSSAAAVLDMPSGRPGKRARRERGSYASSIAGYASSIAGDHAVAGPVGRRSDYVFDDYSTMYAHPAMNHGQNLVSWNAMPMTAYTESMNATASVKVAAEVSPSQAPCFVSTNSLRRMRKRAQTVVKDNWLPRDISMRTKGMALPVKGSNGTVATTRRGQKGSAAAAAANAGSSGARPSEGGALEALETLEAGEGAAAAGEAAAATEGAAAAFNSHIKAVAADANAAHALASTAAADADARSHSPSGYSIKGAAHSRDTDNSKETDTRALDKTDTPRVYSSVSLDKTAPLDKNDTLEKTETLDEAQRETAQMAPLQEWAGTSAGGTGCDVPGDPRLETAVAEEEGGPAGAAQAPDAKHVQALT